MDLSIYESSDATARLHIDIIEGMRVNKSPHVILCRGFIGGSEGRQLEQITTAMSRAQDVYKSRGITLKSEMYTNDFIKNTMHWGPKETIDSIMGADFHLMVAPFHEGNISKTPSWNIPNILANAERLRYHLGNTMGRYSRCPLLRGDKKDVYEAFPDHCLPTITIALPKDEGWQDDRTISEEDWLKLERSVNHCIIFILTIYS